MPDEFFDKLEKLVISELELPKETEIKMNDLLYENLGADSLEKLELIYAIEKELGISLYEGDKKDKSNYYIDKSQGFKTVRDVYNFVKERIKTNQQTY